MAKKKKSKSTSTKSAPSTPTKSTKVTVTEVTTPIPTPTPIATPTPIVATPGSASELDYWRFTDQIYNNGDRDSTLNPDTSGLWEYAPEFVPLSRYDPRFNEIANAFHEGWIHQHKRADIIAIYHVDEEAFCMWQHGQKFNRYLKSTYGWTRPKLKFHGTTRACAFGNPGRPLEPCWNEQCHFCCILWRGFRLETAKFGGMFGQGIYSSDASSKADHYVKNLHNPFINQPRAILVCRVVCDKPQRVVGPDYHRRQPDSGYNCVEGLTKKDGGTVRYPETIVYREDAIAPVAVVIYEKEYIKAAKEAP
ncbi:hypothetical protein QBC37DRAFT_425522 [Rhypophila decipiens]|uniref:PARP catalytic domain-containing protein n=1 Tax=Rhypophila decipiens TaxID=261697 RepID=A0AAN7B8P2_9PEZI|nr:hypothetical protein QBC37DRAFT_425522 [Rhypophila decipiens]